jgi:hypothetical protein
MTANDYRSVTEIMRAQEFQFITYQLPEERPLKFVLRGVYCEPYLSTVEEDLRAQGVTPLRVARIHTEDILNGERKKPSLPSVLVHIPRIESPKVFRTEDSLLSSKSSDETSKKYLR